MQDTWHFPNPAQGIERCPHPPAIRVGSVAHPPGAWVLLVAGGSPVPVVGQWG